MLGRDLLCPMLVFSPHLSHVLSVLPLLSLLWSQAIPLEEVISYVRAC